MKNIKLLVILPLILLLTPFMLVKASEDLSIDNKEYDEATSVLTIAGHSSYAEVMVSVFHNDQLLSFKTVTANNNSYNATVKISFAEDQTITIKVGDINSEDYELTTLNVKKSLPIVKPSTLTDDGGNSLTILDGLTKFETEDELDVQIINNFSEFVGEEKNKLEFLKRTLGTKKELIAIMMINVIRNRHSIELPEINKGYELFLNVPEQVLDGLKNPHIARILDDIEFTFEEAQELKYNSQKQGILTTLNNIGLYVLYDDISIYYKFLDNTENPIFIINKDGSVTLRIDADYQKFLAVYVDNKLVDKKNYDSKSGSTIITFKKDYLKSLSAGKHAVKIDFTDGEANTTLTIAEKETNPKTGDKIISYLVLFLIGILGICIALSKTKKTKND